MHSATHPQPPSVVVQGIIHAFLLMFRWPQLMASRLPSCSNASTACGLRLTMGYETGEQPREKAGPRDVPRQWTPSTSESCSRPEPDGFQSLRWPGRALPSLRNFRQRRRRAGGMAQRRGVLYREGVLASVSTLLLRPDSCRFFAKIIYSGSSVHHIIKSTLNTLLLSVCVCVCRCAQVRPRRGLGGQSAAFPQVAHPSFTFHQHFPFSIQLDNTARQHRTVRAQRKMSASIVSPIANANVLRFAPDTVTAPPLASVAVVCSTAKCSVTAKPGWGPSDQLMSGHAVPSPSAVIIPTSTSGWVEVT